MPNYRYRAINANGELVSGAIAAPAPGDVAQRVERLGLVLVDNVTLEEGGAASRAFGLFGKPRAEDVTLFTRDLALLLRAGARINDGLELLAADRDFGRLRPVVRYCCNSATSAFTRSGSAALKSRDSARSAARL